MSKWEDGDIACPECRSPECEPTGEPDENGLAEYRCGECGCYFVDDA